MAIERLGVVYASRQLVGDNGDKRGSYFRLKNEEQKAKENSKKFWDDKERSMAFHEGDHVCVGWNKDHGYCGNVDRVSGNNKIRIQITEINCGIFGCNASSNCSGGRDININNQDANAAHVGDSVWANNTCVTSR